MTRAFTPPRSRLRLVVHPSTREPGRWQLTAFDGDEPVGHTTWPSEADAVASALGRFVGPEPPVGSRDYVEVDP